MSDSPIQTALQAIDALDLEAVTSLFGPDATLATAFGESAAGREQIRDLLARFFAELRATEHHVSSEWNPDPGVWIAEMTGTYELRDFSRRGPYQRALILRTADGGIKEMRIYGAHELPLPEGGRPYLDVHGPHGWLPTL